MRGTRAIVVGVASAAAAFALAGCGGGDDEGTATETETTITETTDATDTTGQAGGTLIGSVGPGFEISLSTEDGQPVSTLAAGSYTIEVDDQSDIHNFHLIGSGVDEATDVGAVGAETFDVDLEPGSYTYVCDPHQTTMKGSFEVTG